MDSLSLKIRACCRAAVGEPAVFKVYENRVGERHPGAVETVGVHYIAAGCKKVFPAIIIEIKDAVAPAGFAISHDGQAAGISLVLKEILAHVAVERHRFTN